MGIWNETFTYSILMFYFEPWQLQALSHRQGNRNTLGAMGKEKLGWHLGLYYA